MSDKPLRELRAYKALAAHHQKVGSRHLRQLFADESDRGERYTAEAAGLFLDYSKNRITGETLGLLLQLAEESGLRRAHQCHVRGREDQHDRAPRRVACGAARPRRDIDRRGR